MYVPPGPEGSLTFVFEQLPKSTGIYEMRYHVRNTYTVIKTVPLQVVDSEEPDTGGSSSGGSGGEPKAAKPSLI